MDVIILKARAKINLALDVIRKRDDGYHDLEMIMQTLYLHDTLLIRKTSKYPFKLATDAERLPCDERNLVHQAAAYMMKEFKISTGLFMHIKKEIPMAAGLAGGSADCAAALVGLNKMFNLGLSVSDLMAIGKRFGADVPYCVIGGLCKAEGIGDVLTPLPRCKGMPVVLAKPPISLSTAQVFKEFIVGEAALRPDIGKMIEDLGKNDIASAARGFCNVLEPANIHKHPEIGLIKKELEAAGCLGSLMSGSGPSVFGFFDSQKAAWSAMRRLRVVFPRTEVFLTGTCFDVWS
jgi:4-diphosphocytidyl-2-C-methyl-D-erythritol kinase